MTKTVEQAQTDLEAANAEFMSELAADCLRGEGSGAQERRREERQEALRNRVWDCERALQGAKRSEAGQA